MHKTLHEKPVAGTHWSIRKMKTRLTSVTPACSASGRPTNSSRIWVKTFKLSNENKRFVEKVQDLFGLYLDPPDKALVFSVDEKSQIQALDRPRARLADQERPMRHYDARLQTPRDNDVVRSTRCRHRQSDRPVYAATSPSGMAQVLAPHRSRETPKHLDVHLIADNYATHKHASVRVWLKRHKRFHMHFTPTSASWLNQVERFFGLITEDRIRCGAFKSVTQLEAAIQEYLENHNADPKPFIWTASRHHNPQKGGPWETSVRVGTLAACRILHARSR